MEGRGGKDSWNEEAVREGEGYGQGKGKKGQVRDSESKEDGVGSSTPVGGGREGARAKKQGCQVQGWCSTPQIPDDHHSVTISHSYRY